MREGDREGGDGNEVLIITQRAWAGVGVDFERLEEQSLYTTSIRVGRWWKWSTAVVLKRRDGRRSMRDNAEHSSRRQSGRSIIEHGSTVSSLLAFHLSQVAG